MCANAQWKWLKQVDYMLETDLNLSRAWGEKYVAVQLLLLNVLKVTLEVNNNFGKWLEGRLDFMVDEL
jgi:hypothetical protein